MKEVVSKLKVLIEKYKKYDVRIRIEEDDTTVLVWIEDDLFANITAEGNTFKVEVSKDVYYQYLNYPKGDFFYFYYDWLAEPLDFKSYWESFRYWHCTCTVR